jgi:peptide/nickel transport system substrate-binding protein
MRLDHTLSLALIAAIVTACGGQPSPTPIGARTPDATAAPVSTATPVPTPTATPEPVVFTVGLPGLVDTLDPANAADPGALLITRHLYDGLTRLTPGGTDVEPALAEGWEASADASAYTFTLRGDVTFSTGAPFDATAAKANLDRWLTRTPAGNYPYVPALWGGFADQIDSSGAPLSNVQSVSAPSPDTLVIQLRRPDAGLPATLAMPAFAMVDPAAWVDGFGAPGTQSAGTGPFRLRAWAQPDLVELERNPAYWSQPATVDSLRFKIVADDAQRIIALQVDELDAVAALPASEADLAQSWPVRVVAEPPQQVLYLGFNQARRPWVTPACRQAVALGLDRAALAQAAGGNSLPRAGFLSVSEPAGAQAEQARALWAECVAQQDAPIATPIALYIPPIPRPYLVDPVGFGAALQSQLTALGIETQIVATDWSTQWLPDVQAGRADLFVLGAGSLNGDPGSLLCPLFCGRNAALLTGRDGLALPPDDELAAVIAQAQTTGDGAQRAALYQQAEALIADRLPAVPLSSPSTSWAVRTEWQGEVIGPLEALFTSVTRAQP